MTFRKGKILILRKKKNGKRLKTPGKWRTKGNTVMPVSKPEFANIKFPFTSRSKH